MTWTIILLATNNMTETQISLQHTYVVKTKVKETFKLIQYASTSSLTWSKTF